MTNDSITLIGRRVDQLKRELAEEMALEGVDYRRYKERIETICRWSVAQAMAVCREASDCGRARYDDLRS